MRGERNIANTPSDAWIPDPWRSERARFSLFGAQLIQRESAAVSTTVTRRRYLNAATAREPVAVLGASAAERLGINRIYRGERIWLGGQWLYLAGILKPVKGVLHENQFPTPQAPESARTESNQGPQTRTSPP